ALNVRWLPGTAARAARAVPAVMNRGGLVMCAETTSARGVSTGHFAYRALRNVWPDRVRHSALMLAARITLPHFSAPSAMSFLKSAGEPASAELPKSASRALIL